MTFIASVATAVEEVGQFFVPQLTCAHGGLKDTIAEHLLKKLWHSKKSPKWIPQILREAQKDERVRV